jgi:hypothetical protein
MNKATHAWLAVEAFRMIQGCAKTEAGKKRKLDQLAVLLGQNLRDVVVESQNSPRVVGLADGPVVLASVCRESRCARPNLGLCSGVELPSVRNQTVDAVLPLLYLHDLSSGRTVAAAIKVARLPGWRPTGIRRRRTRCRKCPRRCADLRARRTRG